VLALIVFMSMDHRVMGRFALGSWLKFLGWLTVLVMGAALVALVWSASRR
jgi:Mn2+/Fe2+ NRAMP family transporter